MGEIEEKQYQASSGHRGGQSSRLDSVWSRSVSYDGETSSERYNKMSRRDRARKAFNENPVARTLAKTEVSNVVADGFNLQIKSDNKEFNRYYEARFLEWGESADIRGVRGWMDLQQQCYLSPRRDGDGGVHLVSDGAAGKVQYVPGDLICTPDGMSNGLAPGSHNGGQREYANAHPTNRVLDGVEVDGVGRPVRFHCMSVDQSGRREFQAVEAGSMLYQVPEMDADLGVRGDSCYSTIFQLLDQLDGYVDGVAVAARMATLFSAIFKEATGQKQVTALSSLTNAKGDQQKAITLENGVIKYIGQQDDIVQIDAKQPMQQTPDFIRAILRLIGLPFDMPLELIAKDMSTVNFSSARIGLLGYYRACRARQARFVARCLMPMFRWWMERQRLMQVAGMPGAGKILIPAAGGAGGATLYKASFCAVGWDYTDPMTDVQSDQLQIEMGIKTEHMAAAEHGRDWDEMQEERAVERAIKKLNNLPDVAPVTTRDRIEIPPTKLTTKEEADMAFKRTAWLGFQADGTVADVAANLTDLRTLTGDVGLPLDANYIDPYLPVQVDAGKDLVSGTTVVDPSGDVVGGGLVPAADAVPTASQAPETAAAGK